MLENKNERSNLILPIGTVVFILAGIFGYVFSCISDVETKINDVQIVLTDKVDDSQTTSLEIKAQLAQIQTDLLWIKKELNSKK